MKPGEAAPDFTLTDQGGKTVRLSDFRGKNVVLFFYPKDNTAICTAEACAFRDQYDAFGRAGAEVLGISSDSEESHRGFAEHHRLPYRILSDPSGTVRGQYRVPKTLGFMPGRVTFVIDREGIVRHAFNSQFRAAAHIRGALAVLEGLKA